MYVLYAHQMQSSLKREVNVLLSVQTFLGTTYDHYYSDKYINLLHNLWLSQCNHHLWISNSSNWI